MNLKMFKFSAQNMRTRESADFIGQGETMDEAWKDGVKLLNDKFRANSDGKTSAGKGLPNTMGVLLPDGRRVSRTLKDFESDQPYSESPAQP